MRVPITSKVSTNASALLYSSPSNSNNNINNSSGGGGYTGGGPIRTTKSSQNGQTPYNNVAQATPSTQPHYQQPQQPQPPSSSSPSALSSSKVERLLESYAIAYMESLEKRRGAKALHAESTRQLEQEKLEFEMRKWKFESSLATRRADLHEMKESRRFALEQKRVLKEMQLDISRESRRVMLRARRMQQDEKKLETERILACASLMRNLNEAGFDKKEMLDMVLQ